MVRVRQARRKGVREEPAAERPSREPPAPTWRIWAGLQRAPDRQGQERGRSGTLRLGDVAGREATVKACGVAVAMLQGHSWAPTPSNGSGVNVETIPPVPFPGSSRLPGGKAHRRPMPAGRGGGPAGVRGGGSRAQGGGGPSGRSRAT